jgi:hypothetical protein
MNYVIQFLTSHDLGQVSQYSDWLELIKFLAGTGNISSPLHPNEYLQLLTNYMEKRSWEAA